MDYNAMLFEPSAQQFYPQIGFQQPGYHRLDAYFSTKVKRAHIFIKMINLLEGLPDPGYFTTLFYPMQDRAMVVGVNVKFFD